MASWAVPSAKSKHEAAIDCLNRLQLLATVIDESGQARYILNSTFQEQLQATIMGGFQQKLLTPTAVVNACPTEQQLFDYANDQWENLLLYLVGSSDTPPLPPVEMKGNAPINFRTLLLSAGLMIEDKGTGEANISNVGFKFLLMETYAQLWTILKQYIAAAESLSGDELASAVSFLLQLGFQPGECIHVENLTASQRVIATHLAQLGLLKAFKVPEKGVWLAPTVLASVVAGGGGMGPKASGDGYVIVETNYRVYAYTSSPVRQAILRLFIKCEVLLPNLFVGTITRESAVGALESGIDAEQIIGFMRNHAHPRVSNNVPIVPIVVSDQLRLWQQDLQRLKWQNAVLYKAFESSELYRRTKAFAKGTGGILYSDDDTQQLLVVSFAHEDMKAEIKSAKSELKL